jgi:hypothetical protein
MAVPRYRVTPRWRFHYPSLYVTRVRLHDDQGHHADLWDAEQATNVARVLNGGATPSTEGLTKYTTVAWARGKALIEQRRAGFDETVGVANDCAFADLIAEVLNRLDPYEIAPAKRVRAYWF